MKIKKEHLIKKKSINLIKGIYYNVLNNREQKVLKNKNGGNSMKMKRLVAMLLAGVMTLSLAACGGSSDSTSSSDSETSTESSASGDEKLVIWTLSADLESFGEQYAEETGVEVETVIIDPADYLTKVQTALSSGTTEVDIIVGEPQMLETMFEAGYFEDLNQDPYNAQDYSDLIVDYVWEVGQDSEGIQRAISYQITPAGFYYRRDIALEVFGTDDPDEIGELFADYETIVETAYTLDAAGYKIFASDAETNYFTGDSAWVVDGVLNVSDARYDYMDLCVELYQSDLTAYASQWAAPWYQAMNGEVPVLTSETQWGTDDMNIWDEESFNEATEGYDTTEVFAFGLPSWGTLILRDNAEDTSGLWGVCSGPCSGFGGGTYVGISALSENKDLAWDFIEYVNFNEETSEWWIEVSEGDVVSLISVLEAHAEDENETYGGQQLYSFWLEQAEDIDYSVVTKYDTAIGDAWGTAITSVKTGEMTEEEAIEFFYDTVESTYPEIEVNR